MGNQFVSLDTRIVDCDFCGEITDDPFEVYDSLICGKCVILWEMMEKFVLLGGTREVLLIQRDGQIRMEM